MSGQMIIGFDGSPAAMDALGWAADEAGRHHVEAVAVAVLDPSSDWSADDAAHLLRTALATRASHHRVALQVRTGDPARELVQACTSGDLLVVGSRGRNPIKGLLLGSVSRSCLELAPCPVVVVRTLPTPGDPGRRVLVGVDGSPHSRLALQLGDEEARLRGDVLHAVHAVPREAPAADPAAPDRRQLIDWGSRLVKHELAAAAVAARPVIEPGRPGDVLVRHSAHADLLVLGALGGHPAPEVLVGTTTDQCVRHAHCPVMVVRASGRPPRPGSRQAR